MTDLTNPLTLNVPQLASGTPLDTAVARTLETDRVAVIGARGGSLAPFLVRLSQRRRVPIVIVVETFGHAEPLVRDLRYHWDAAEVTAARDQVLFFRPFNYGPYDELSPDRRTALSRAGVLFRLAYGHEWRFLVVTADAVMRRVIPRAAFESACLPLTPEMEIKQDTLIALLERGGYHRTPLVEEPGTYALRGSLVDVYPPYLARPARIDFWGPAVEKIRSFDPETQASGAEIPDVWIHPIRSTLLPVDAAARQAAIARLRSACDAVNQPTRQTEQLIEDALSGRLLTGIQGLEPAFHCPLGRLTDYLPSTIMACIENPAAMRLAWRKQQRKLEEDFERRIARGTPSFEPSAFIVEPEEMAEFFTSHPTVLANAPAVLGGPDDPFETRQDTIDLNAKDTADLGERIKQLDPSDTAGMNLVTALSQYLAKLIAEGYCTTIIAHQPGQADRLAGMLRHRGLDVHLAQAAAAGTEAMPLRIAVGELARGCILPGDGQCWIAEEEVFKRRSRRRRATRSRSRPSLTDFTELKRGDFVVHLEHGIGRYEGLTRHRIRNAEMDFLTIVYRDDDKLYVPVYRLNQVQKYRGAEGHAPRLDKLGGQTFARAVGAAKQASRELAGQLLTLYAKRAAAARTAVPALDDTYHAFEAAFPFEETEDQERAIDEVMADLEGTQPMDRLVCGDVGFGKTEVALRAVFRVVMDGRQAAVLAPTTVLAQQHFQTFEARFAPYPVRVAMLSRFKTKTENSEVVAALKEGTLDIVIGTHRLLSKDVHFNRLGLLVIDEEHRFGVTHKERIRALKASIDTLVLTATPIPRTLQMALSGVRDLSLIATAPADRRPVHTMICRDDPAVLRQAIERELAREGQLFFVHNRVRDIERVAERVQALVPDARIAVGHGQMKEDRLERLMLDFVAGRYDILVCTSIIESGLDIPRANTIIIDRADTFGMAQLYQLRGRVGRSSVQAYAYLIVPPMAMLSEASRERVETLARYTDLGSGFSVATMDMEIRGAGNLLGAEQSGDVHAVGLEMFCDLVAEATADLRGEKIVREVEPELTFDQPGYIPEKYLPEVGQRLQYYKKLASVSSEASVASIATEMADRLGPLPEETEVLVSGMVVKALSRGLGIRGVEVSSKWLIFHLAEDSRVDPNQVIEIVREERGRVQLTSDLRIKVRRHAEETDGVGAAIHFLHRLSAYDNNPSIL